MEFTDEEFDDGFIDDEEKEKRKEHRNPGSKSRVKIRNLKQYKDLTDAEFDELQDKREFNAEPDRDWENRIKRKMDEFSKDYDLDDMKINDMYSLRALCAAILRLEDYDSKIGKLMKMESNEYVLGDIKTLSEQQKGLRDGISKLQDDLKISRKVRKSDKEETAEKTIAELYRKAKKFYTQKMLWVVCPKCNTVLATAWFLYPEDGGSSIKVKCHHDMPDGTKCTGELEISTKKLLDAGGCNRPEILPERLR
jgi:hypothetical protein